MQTLYWVEQFHYLLILKSPRQDFPFPTDANQQVWAYGYVETVSLCLCCKYTRNLLRIASEETFSIVTKSTKYICQLLMNMISPKYHKLQWYYVCIETSKGFFSIKCILRISFTIKKKQTDAFTYRWSKTLSNWSVFLSTSSSGRQPWQLTLNITGSGFSLMQQMSESS